MHGGTMFLSKAEGLWPETDGVWGKEEHLMCINAKPWLAAVIFLHGGTSRLLCQLKADSPSL